MKVLTIGDVFGKPGRRALAEWVPRYIHDEKVDFIVANGENVAGGKGLTVETCKFMMDLGIDVVTTGNHVRDQKEIDPVLNTDARLIRPLNYPEGFPGRGVAIRSARNGKDVAVINSMGRVHIGDLENPFTSTLKAVEEARKSTPIVIVDFHAEATSEKRAMGWYLDGHASAVVGTHSHVQTADEEILPKGTAYITDLGMTGPYESVIGLKIELAFARFLNNDKSKFDVGKRDARFCGALIEIDETTGRALSIKRVRHDLPDLN